MDMLLVPVPLFNRYMVVQSYYFRFHKGNELLNAHKTSRVFDGVVNSPLLETINNVGLDAMTMNKPIFVSTNNFMLLVNLEEQCSAPPEKIVFLLEPDVVPDEPYLSKIKALRAKGYHFALHNTLDFLRYAPILEHCDYLSIDVRALGCRDAIKLGDAVKRRFRHINTIATHIDSMNLFYKLQNDFAFFEGPFYRIPVTKGHNEVSPLKTNLINLLNMVQDGDFEFNDIARVIQRDTALTISLLRLINSPYMGRPHKVSSVNQAVAILGQDEMVKWVTTAVAKLLGADRPDEITRISLTRARFAENLAPLLGVGDNPDSLFLMGLFSVLNLIMEMPMEDALKLVRVSDNIHQALEDNSGPYYPVLDFIRQYEAANWPAVSRALIIHNLEVSAIFQAYTDSLAWYNDLIKPRIP